MFSLLLAFLPWVGLSLLLKRMQLDEIDLIPSYLLVWFFVQISNLCFQYLKIHPHGAVTLRVARDGNKGCTVVWRSCRLVWQIRTLRFFSEYFPKRLERLILTKYVEMFCYNEYNFFFSRHFESEVFPLWSSKPNYHSDLSKNRHPSLNTQYKYNPRIVYENLVTKLMKMSSWTSVYTHNK